MSILIILMMLMFNYFITTLVSFFIPNHYLASMISSLILAFLYPLFLSGRSRKFKDFIYNFLHLAIIFLLWDLLFFVIGG